MNCFDSPTIGQVLMEAQLGNQAAKQRMANWMMDEVQAKVMSALKLKRASKSQSSMISNVLVKLVRGETIQRAPNVFYLRGAIGKTTREILIDLWRQRQRRAAKGKLVVASKRNPVSQV